MKQRMKMAFLAILAVCFFLMVPEASAEGYSKAGEIDFDSYGLCTILTDAEPEILRVRAAAPHNHPDQDCPLEWVIDFRKKAPESGMYEVSCSVPESGEQYTLCAGRTQYGTALSIVYTSASGRDQRVKTSGWAQYEIVSSQPEYCAPAQEQGFLRVLGENFFDPDGSMVVLRSIGMTANAFNSRYEKNIPATWCISEEAFREISSLGFNCIRLTFGYQLLEDDSHPYVYKQSGWDWLDQIVRWAEKYGIRICLNLHYPQGGCQYTADGIGLWTDNLPKDTAGRKNLANDYRDNQNRIIAMWRAIAQRYRDNTTFAGWGIINELHIPMYADGDMIRANLEYSTLFQRIIDAIREVDPNHIIFAERALWTYVMPSEQKQTLLEKSLKLLLGEKPLKATSIYVNDSFMYYPLIRDSNLVLEWHDYRGCPEAGEKACSKQETAAMMEETNALFRRLFGSCTIFIGEYGSGWGYDASDAGKLQWVADLDAYCEENSYSRNLHCYYGYDREDQPFNSNGLRYVTKWKQTLETGTLYEPLAEIFRSRY